MVVKYRFAKQGVVENFDHIPIAAELSDAQGCPNIFPGNKLNVSFFGVRSFVIRLGSIRTNW